jgi:hypothetical protein
MPRTRSLTLHAECGTGRLRVWAEGIPAGDDIFVYIGGGEKPHVGSFSLSDASHAFFCASLPGHKDYMVSTKAASKLSQKLGKTCAVVAGIHIDNATKPEIELLLKNSDKCIELLIRKLKKL